MCQQCFGHISFKESLLACLQLCYNAGRHRCSYGMNYTMNIIDRARRDINRKRMTTVEIWRFLQCRPSSSYQKSIQVFPNKSKPIKESLKKAHFAFIPMLWSIKHSSPIIPLLRNWRTLRLVVPPCSLVRLNAMAPITSCFKSMLFHIFH